MNHNQHSDYGYFWNIRSLNMGSALALRLALVMVIYTITRLVFYVYNKDLLGIDSLESFWLIMRGGLIFDLSGILYVNLLVILLHLLPFKFRYRSGYQRAVNIVYWACNIPAFIINLADVGYYRFSGGRTTVAVFHEFGNENPLNFVNFIWTFWPITLTAVALIYLWVRLYHQIKPRTSSPKMPPVLYYGIGIVQIFLTALLVVGGIRGGWSSVTRPLAPSDASLYVVRPEQRAMTLNTPFVMIRTADKHVLPHLSFMSDDAARALFDPVRRAPEPSPFHGIMKGRNVVVIIWESMAREWVGKLNQDIAGYKGYTPFIDSLLDHSYYFEDGYANANKSVDAMPAIFASVQRPMSPFISSSYSGNKVNSIINAVSKVGYSSMFLHNAPNGSMGFDAMAKQLGFEQYRGMTEFNNDAEFDGSWGIWDEPFLQFVVQEIGTLREPFFVSEFTTSSHHPFRIPEKYKDVFPEGPIPMHKCVRYTDHALEKFFRSAEKQPWYQNTLFVILADHAIPGVLEEYTNSRGRHRIPIIFFDPQGKFVGKDSTTIAQQADMLPTLVDLLGLDYPHVAFGHNMLNPNEDHFAIHVVGEAYQMVRGDYVIQHDGQRTISLYNFRQDPLLKKDIKATDPQGLAIMEPLIKAYLQQFTQRMRENKLTL